MSEPEEVDCYEDASNEMIRETKDYQRRKLWAVTFTSEILQTLVDDQTTVYLSTSPLSVKKSNELSQMANTISLDEPRALREVNILGVEVILDLIVPRVIVMHEIASNYVESRVYKEKNTY